MDIITKLLCSTLSAQTTQKQKPEQSSSVHGETRHHGQCQSPVQTTTTLTDFWLSAEHKKKTPVSLLSMSVGLSDGRWPRQAWATPCVCSHRTTATADKGRRGQPRVSVATGPQPTADKGRRGQPRVSVATGPQPTADKGRHEQPRVSVATGPQPTADKGRYGQPRVSSQVPCANNGPQPTADKGRQTADSQGRVRYESQTPLKGLKKKLLWPTAVSF